MVDTDPTRAEVATKYLFLGGAAAIDEAARTRRTAALWVTTDGTIATSPMMDSFVIWRAG